MTYPHGYFFGKPMPMQDTKAESIAKGMTWEVMQGERV